MDPNPTPIALTFFPLHTHMLSSSLPSPAPSLSWWCHTHATPGAHDCHFLNSKPPSWPSRRLCHRLRASLVPDGSGPADYGSQNPVNINSGAWVTAWVWQVMAQALYGCVYAIATATTRELFWIEQSGKRGHSMCEKHCEGLTQSECYFFFERRGRAWQPLKLNYTNN